jgi:hypothetical protein
VAGSTARCDSCGRTAPDELDEGDVVQVRRVYVTPESWDSDERYEVVDDVERWCFVCSTHYPHQLVGEDAPER